MRYSQLFKEQPSQEAVDYQKTFSLFHALTEMFRQAKEREEKKLNSRDLMDLGWGKILKEYCGLNAEIIVMRSKYPNAAVRVPLFNARSIFYQRFYEHIRNHPYIKKQRKQLLSLMEKEGDEAMVDRKKGKVGGLWSALPIEFYITQGTLKHMEAEEIAAIMIHEIGHAFSYFETAYRTMTTNLAIENAIEEIVGHKEPLEKMKVIDRLKDNGYMSWSDRADQIIKVEDKERLRAIILSSCAEEMKSRNDFDVYNETAFEQQADQFVVRMGGGQYLASGLKKLYDVINPIIKFNNYKTFVIRVMVMTGLTLVGGAAFFIWYSLIFLWLDWVFVGYPEIFDSYDKQKDRIKRIRQELIGGLKKFSDDKELVAIYLSDIDAVSEIMNKSENQSSLFGRKFVLFAKLFTNIYKTKARQQAIEELINNDLFVIGHQLKQLGK